MNRWLLCIVGFIPFGLMAQTEYFFNKTFFTDTSNIAVRAVLDDTDDGHLMFGEYHWPNDGKAIYMRKLDKLGMTKWITHIDDSPIVGNIATGSQVVHTNDGYIAIAYTELNYEDEEMDIRLTKISREGVPIWNRLYATSSNDAIRALIQTTDDGYAIVGSRYVEGDTTRYYLLKTDSEGFFEWENTYMLDDSSLAHSVVQTEDGGFMLSGFGLSYENDYQTYIVKTDALGNQEWDLDLGTPQLDCGGRLLPMGGGQYILTSCITLQSGKRENYIAAISVLGQVLWEKTYAPFEETRTIQTHLKHHGDGYIGAGYFINEYNEVESYLIRFFANGDIDWIKEFTNDPQEDWYLKDIEPTSDGGYIMSGFKFSVPQKGWVVKIDSLGNTCQPADCDSVGVVSTGHALGLPVSLVHISPNPAKDVVQVQYDVSGIYPIVEFSLFNMNGQLISSYQLPAWKQREQVDISDLAAGVYLYEATYQSRKIGGGKLVVE